ncbi:hypothetical protein KP509_1Z237700 [Ceratopteris richardii]|nr:hypothetical protein KP509_1Z237700 [Ceratopteris richardii]
MCLESNGVKQSKVSTQMFGSDSESDTLCSRNYPVKSIVPQAGRYFRESGGTGVFLPRCKSTTRNLRMIDNRRKLDAQMPARCTKSVLHSKKKENVSCSSIQYTSYPQMPEAPPDSRSLPPDWMY